MNTYNPYTKMLITLVCAFLSYDSLGLVKHKLPAHIGGFVMGLLVGTFFYPVISETKRHRFIMWCFRLAAVPLAVILFVSLIRNFYTSDPYAGRFDFCILGHIF